MTVRPEARDRQPDQASLDGDLRRLDADLRQLEVAYTLFFARRRSRPPLGLRSRVEAVVRRWDRVPIHESAERFRCTTLQMRFRTLANLWDRRLRALEEGRSGPPSGTP